ncbi:MAG TPA: hypothetical protein VM432_02355 [Bdellovibrionales bacterium]|nr:hypothetical protein [Bdellovibrionales bacterium]
MKRTQKIILGITATLSLGACTVKETVVEHEGVPGTLEALYSAGINVAAATDEECTGGGNVYSVYSDENSNGVLDESEEVLNVQIVCNGEDGSNGSDGEDGSNGYSTAFSLTRVETSAEACSSLSGLQIDSGLDADRDGILDAEEIASTKVLCDGANGAAGAAGAAGSNGYDMVFQTVAASPEQCPAGGSNILMALDTDRSGTYSAQDSNQQAITLCNGQNGTNGQNGQDGEDGEDGEDAILPAYAPVDVIYPCGNNGSYPEALLRLSNGQVLASFSENANGKNTRFSFIPDGSYVTTDGRNCQFSLSTSGTTRSVKWSNQVQKSWQISY